MTTSRPARASASAQASPITPAPTTTVSITSMASGSRRVKEAGRNDRASTCQSVLLAQAEVALADAGVVRQRTRRAVEDHFAGFQHIRVIGNLQRSACVLLHQQDRHAAPLQFDDDVKDLA